MTYFTGYTGNISANNVNVSNSGYFTNNLYVGPEGAENIVVNNVDYNASFIVSDIGSGDIGTVIFHRHSTTTEPIIGGIRSNSDDETEVVVTNGQSLFTIYSGGWTGNTYQLSGGITFAADNNGTISDTSLPGLITFNVTPDGTVTPTTALSIYNDGSAEFASNVKVDGSLIFNDSTVQTTAYQVVKTGYNVSAPSLTLGNIIASVDGSGNPTIRATTTVSGPYSGVSQLWNGSTYPLASIGALTATWPTAFGSGVGVTFANPGDQLSMTLNDNTNGNIYKITWIAGQTVGNAFIQIERLV